MSVRSENCSIALRPYQLDAVERVREQIRSGARRVLIVAPTGSGKTVVAAHIMARAVESGRRVLFVAHRRELIDQCFRKLEDSGVGQVGVIMAGDPRSNPGASVQVASIDTLRHRAKPEANLVIVDEAHRALAKSYVELASMYPASVHLGLTATPYRADGRGLCDAYDALVVVASPKELIAEGFLVEPTVYTLAAHELPDLSAVKVKGGPPAGRPRIVVGKCHKEQGAALGRAREARGDWRAGKAGSHGSRRRARRTDQGCTRRKAGGVGPSVRKGQGARLQARLGLLPLQGALRQPTTSVFLAPEERD